MMLSGDYTEGSDLSLVVSDAGPLIHLDELNSLDLLSGLGKLLVPQQVWDEVIRHRPGLCATSFTGMEVVSVAQSPSVRLRAIVDSFRLDIGETTALICMESHLARLFLCDDAAARLAGESMGFSVHGTIGILIRSIRTGMRTRDQVLDILRNLSDRSTLHLSRRLLEMVIDNIEQDTSFPK